MEAIIYSFIAGVILLIFGYIYKRAPKFLKSFFCTPSFLPRGEVFPTIKHNPRIDQRSVEERNLLELGSVHDKK